MGIEIEYFLGYASSGDSLFCDKGIAVLLVNRASRFEGRLFQLVGLTTEKPRCCVLQVRSKELMMTRLHTLLYEVGQIEKRDITSNHAVSKLDQTHCIM